MNTKRLLEAVRGDLTEKFFTGTIFIVSKTGKILNSIGDREQRCFLRSCEKPFQAMGIFDYGLVEHYALTEAEIALSYASHTGSKEHLDALEALLTKIGLKESQLLCPPHPPLDKTERHRLIRESLKPKALHNNCSAKHLYFTAICKKMDWETESYIEFSHPLQQYVTEQVKSICQIETVHLGYDGCGMPVHGMPLINMGVGFANFFNGNNSAAKLLSKAVTANPVMAGGRDRIDSGIISASRGKLMAKVGAEGLMIISPFGSGEALVIKVDDGNTDMRNLIVVEALAQLGWIPDPEKHPELKPFTDTAIYNFSGDTVGEYKFTFKV